MKVEKLSLDFSLANGSCERMSKENTLANESLASLKANHGELQESFSSLTVQFNDLEVNYSALWEGINTRSRATYINPNASTSEGCSRCYKFDGGSCDANLAKLERLIEARMLNSKG